MRLAEQEGNGYSVRINAVKKRTTTADITAMTNGIKAIDYFRPTGRGVSKKSKQVSQNVIDYARTCVRLA